MGKTVGAVIATSVAANATNANVVTGNTFERAPFDAILSIYESGSATGLESQLNVQGDVINDPQPVNTQNRIPVVPDDLTLGGIPVAAGALIKVRVQNTTAGALTHRLKLMYEEAEVIEEMLG